MENPNVFVTKEGRKSDVFEIWSKLVHKLDEECAYLETTENPLDPDDFMFIRGIIDEVFCEYDTNCKFDGGCSVMGLVLTTDERGVRVWRDDKSGFPKYSISYSKKGEDGKYQNAYIDVRFAKGVELENSTDIMILDSFPSFNIGSDGKKYPYWFIKDWERMDGQPKVNNIRDAVNMPVDIDDEEMPFN